MKKLFYLMAVASLFIALPLTSCSDDDDDEVIGDSVNDSEQVDTTPKTLTGVLSVNVAGTDVNPYYQDVTVTNNGDGTLNIYIEDFSFTYGTTFSLGEVTVDCTYDGTNFTGDTSVNYVVDIPFTITGTYDGTDLVFSSEFSVGVDVAFTFSTKETLPEESNDQGSSFVQPEGSKAYTGTLSGTYFMGFLSLDETEATIYYADGVIALEELEVMGMTLSNIYINYDNANDGTFTDGTAEASLFSFPLSFEGVSGSVTFDETGAITLSVSLSIPLDTFGISLSDILDSFDLGSFAGIFGDKNDIDITIDFTNVYDPFKIVGETETISGTLKTSDTDGGTAATVTVGVNGNGDTVYSISEFSITGSYTTTTYSSVVIVVDAEGTASAQVTTSGTLGLTSDATSVTFNSDNDGGFTANIQYGNLIKTTLSLTFVVSAE